GVGSERPCGSVTVSWTTKLPMVLNVTAPGSLTVTFGAPSSKSQKYVNVESPSASLAPPRNTTLCPSSTVTGPAGWRIEPAGGVWGFPTLTIRSSGVGSATPEESIAANRTRYIPTALTAL